MSSFSDIFSGAYESLQGTVSDIVKTGAPAVIAGIEQYGAQQLQGFANQNIATAQQNANAIAANPTTSAFGSIMSSITGSIAQGTFFKQYGTECLVGIVGILLIGRLLK